MRSLNDIRANYLVRISWKHKEAHCRNYKQRAPACQHNQSDVAMQKNLAVFNVCEHLALLRHSAADRAGCHGHIYFFNRRYTVQEPPPLPIGHPRFGSKSYKGFQESNFWGQTLGGHSSALPCTQKNNDGLRNGRAANLRITPRNFVCVHGRSKVISLWKLPKLNFTCINFS